MGLFSWKTQDTDRSISIKEPFPVIMSDDKGNRWHESEYEGYGVFGGKDYYSLLDEMNGGSGDRVRGIELYYSGDDRVKFPSLTEKGGYLNEKPEDCEYQGYFYPEYDEEEEEDCEEWD